MLQKIRTYVTQHHMITPGDGIVAGVSGGADSVCLFQVLLELRREIPFELCVVHVNHGIRSEAGEDAEYVRRLCAQHEISFHLVEQDVRGVAEQEHLSEEEAGRLVRYHAFEEVRQRTYGAQGKIAVAHNQNDRAETVLFQLFRGSGIDGMAGIMPVRDRIIRPLLCVSREEIEEYLSGRGISYQTDATNEQDDYARNRIRHHILPYAEQQICAGTVAHINKTAELLGQAAEYLKKQTLLAYRECVFPAGEALSKDVLLQKHAWEKQEPYIRKSMIHELFRQLTPHAKNITSQHVEAVYELFDRQVGRRLDLPYEISAVRSYEGVAFHQGRDTRQSGGTCKDEGICQNGDELQAELSGESGTVQIEGLRISWRVFENRNPAETMQNIPKNECTKWFDYDKIKEPIGFRHRKTGDFLCVNECGGTKSVKEYMIHEKIPQQRRDSVWLVCAGSSVLWIVGYRSSQDCRISSQTGKIIEIQIEEDRING